MRELEHEMEHGSEVPRQLSHPKDRDHLHYWVTNIASKNIFFPASSFPLRCLTTTELLRGRPAGGLTGVYGFVDETLSTKRRPLENPAAHTEMIVDRRKEVGLSRYKWFAVIHNQMRAVPTTL